MFLNKRGDLLVGFQNNLHYVNGLDYLPNNKLDLLSVSTITDEQMEYCIPFDPLLKFWYDANRVRTVRTMPIEAEGKKLCVEESAIYLEAITNKDLGHAHLVTSGLKKLRHSVFVLRALGNKRDQKSRIEWQKSMEKILNDTESEDIDIYENHKKVPSNDNIIDSLAELILQNELLNSTRSDNKIFWPCAPDGFIPNSVVRDRVQPKPSANKVLPWKPRTKVFKSEPTFEDFIEEDDDFDQTRTWLSGDDEEDDDFMFYDEWPDFKTKYTAKKITSGKKSLKKKEKRVKEKASTEEKIKPVIKKENKTAKLKDIKHKQKIIRAKPNTKRDGDQTQNISIADRFLPSPNTDSNDEFQVPPPYDKYFDENWFPTDIGFDANIITRSLLGKIQHIPPFSLRDLLDCIVDIHKSKHLSDDVFNHVINSLFDLLEHPSGQIRHYAVRTLLSLGANKKEVVLKLVPKLGDPVEAVREQVKIALEEMAGIRDADTLVQTLKDFGEYRETELSDDREVIESLKLAIVERGDILRQKMSMFSERDARLTEAMRKFNEPSKYAIQKDRHGRKRKQSHKEHLDVLYRSQQQSLSNRTLDDKFVDSKKNILIDVPEIRAPTNGDNGNDDTTAECFNVNTVLNGNIAEEEIYKHTDKQHLSIDHAHDKPLFTQKSRHLYQLHELLCETTEDTAEDALLSLAPHIYERFNNLTPENNLMKKIVGAKEISTPLGENAMAEIAIKQMQVDFTQALNEKLEKLYQEDCTTTTNEKETPPHKNQKAKNYAKAVVLAVAFSALQARRCNNNDLQNHGLLGNETLYHLTMLLGMFQSRKRIKSSILSEISKVAFDMKNGFAASTSQDNKVMKHVVKQNPSNHNYPGVNSEEELVQGVCGERIMKRIYYVTKCSQLNKFTQIRSLPERNGNFTVNMHHGVTRYGAMRCDWTTLTPSYILSTTKHRALMKERSIINQKIYESKMKNAKNTLALHLRKRLSPVNRLNNTPVDRGKDSALLNKHPVLPRIERTPVRDVHSNIDKSKSGTALRLIRQVDFV